MSTAFGSKGPTAPVLALVAPRAVPIKEGSPALGPTSAGSSVEARDQRIRRLVDAHFDAVWRLVRRLGVPENEADDAAQRAFVVAVRRLDEIDPNRERAYLMGIAARTASETRRTLRRRREDAVAEDAEWADPAPDPESQIDRRRARARLDAIVASMPVEIGTVFVLREIEGMTLPEIAQMHGIPLGTATSRLRRARELFRKGCADGP